MSEIKSKLKILCIHGYRQSKQIFREKSGNFRKKLKSLAEFEIIEAPQDVKNLEDQEVANPGEQKGWWFTRPDGYFKSSHESDYEEGMDHSIEIICNAIKEYQPDGLLGFSQGGTILPLLVAKKPEITQQIKFLISICGFRSINKLHQPQYEHKLSIPAMIVIGAEDNIVRKDLSEGLIGVFNDPVVQYSKGGHFVSIDEDDKIAQTQFLNRFKKDN